MRTRNGRKRWVSVVAMLLVANFFFCSIAAAATEVSNGTIPGGSARLDIAESFVGAWSGGPLQCFLYLLGCVGIRMNAGDDDFIVVFRVPGDTTTATTTYSLSATYTDGPGTITNVELDIGGTNQNITTAGLYTYSGAFGQINVVSGPPQQVPTMPERARLALGVAVGLIGLFFLVGRGRIGLNY